MEKFIEDLYNETIDVIIDGIGQEYVEEVKKNYKEYLRKIYINLKITEDNYNDKLNRKKEVNINTFKILPKDDRLSLFVKDEYFDTLNKLSSYALEFALNKNNIEINPDLINKNIELMKECLKQVKEFNKKQAEEIYNDGILDYNYCINNSEKGIVSIRLSHYLSKNVDEEKEYGIK